jgi:hypothetical protein
MQSDNSKLLQTNNQAATAFNQALGGDREHQP